MPPCFGLSVWSYNELSVRPVFYNLQRTLRHGIPERTGYARHPQADLGVGSPSLRHFEPGKNFDTARRFAEPSERCVGEAMITSI